ncbi:MAG: glycoside hydrolase family 125 protein [Chitinophagaceae bacterium]|nr:glycoside hydrolase family 125 protein [Chitinophagaceae bacterium]
MDRRKFIGLSTAAGLSAMIPQQGYSFFKNDFPVVRVPRDQRHFSSPAIEQIISEVSKNIKNKELAWLFNNCFPNTLDTTVDFEMVNGRPDTFVITGDIDAMWLRDSSAQVWPYLSLCKEDKNLQLLIKGVINRQVHFIIKDPYANAFYKDESKVSEWKETDITDMKPGVHERKWEIDSLCYPIRLAYGYWKETGDSSVFDKEWEHAMSLVIRTFKEQQRKTGKGPYVFQRTTAWATDGVTLAGYGYPVKPNGLICSVFRPSDDATIFPYLIPANFFAVVSLKQLSEIATEAISNTTLAGDAEKLALEVGLALSKYAEAPYRNEKIYAYEVNGFGSFNLMDDANVPSLLSLPYLGAVHVNDLTYQRTRKYILSDDNPFFFKGTAGEGIGSPHTLLNMIWPIGITMRALTSADDSEIRKCLTMLQRSNAGTGFMHESFNENDASNFTRKWFAWANTLFGELVLKLYREKKYLLD